MATQTRATLLLLVLYWFSNGQALRRFNWDYNDDYFANLGANIERQVAESLRPLQNLGQQINEDVYQGLKPLREMESKLKIILGNDGTTITTYKPSGRQFIVKHGILYDCEGTISEQDGNCRGTLRKTSFNKKTDFCYANVNTIINNWYCISNGNANSGYINGKLYCSSPEGASTLLISAEEYKNLCSRISGSVSYKYFTTKKLTEYGPDVHCSSGIPQVCTHAVTSRFGNGATILNGVNYINFNK